MMVSLMVGGCLSALGLKLLMILVGYGWSAVWANLALCVPMGVLGFVVHWLVTWRDRQISVATGARRWSTTKVVMGLTSQLSFLLLVGAFGFPFTVVRGGTVLALALPTYAASNGWTFRDNESTDKA
jgi:membrane protease YdiL (CAAX protease family)